MDNEHTEEIQVTPEEQMAEKEALAEAKDDELREKLADDMGLDPEEDKELLEKLVSREKANREKLSKAIQQKIRNRELAQKLSGKPKVNPNGGENPKQEAPDVAQIVAETVRKTLEERDLESLTTTDDIKIEIKNIARLKGISVREAANDPYIKYKMDEVEREQRIMNASPRRTSKGGYSSSYDPSKPLNAANYRLDTEEGRKAWQEAKEAKKQHDSTK